MLAKNRSESDAELPTRPYGLKPPAQFEGMPPQRTHLMLVGEPKPTLRGLTWARSERQLPFEATRLQAMLRLERLNLG